MSETAPTLAAFRAIVRSEIDAALKAASAVRDAQPEAQPLSIAMAQPQLSRYLGDAMGRRQIAEDVVAMLKHEGFVIKRTEPEPLPSKMSQAEFARRKGINKATVWRWVRSGKLRLEDGGITAAEARRHGL